MAFYRYCITCDLNTKGSQTFINNMVYAEYTMDTEMIEEKIGEVLGLEMAAQKAVDQLVSKGLLDKA